MSEVNNDAWAAFAKKVKDNMTDNGGHGNYSNSSADYEEVKWAGRDIKGTFTDKNKLGSEKSEINPELNKFIKRYVKESLKNKY